MGFINQVPGLFTRSAIDSLDSDQIGVYGIFRSNQWIYVGKGDIRKRLLDHLLGDNPLILKNNPTHWVAEVLSQDPSLREKQLIMELDPCCNQRVG